MFWAVINQFEKVPEWKKLNDFFFFVIGSTK